MVLHQHSHHSLRGQIHYQVQAVEGILIIIYWRFMHLKVEFLERVGSISLVKWNELSLQWVISVAGPRCHQPTLVPLICHLMPSTFPVEVKIAAMIEVNQGRSKEGRHTHANLHKCHFHS